MNGGKAKIHRDVLERLWEQGEGIDRIAQVFGVTAPAVRAAARKFGLPDRSPEKVVLPNEERDEALRRMWVEGATKRAIARAIGVHETHVAAMADRLGLPPRDPRGRPPFDTEKARALRAEGKTFKQIGEMLGRSPDWVSGWFRDARDIGPTATPGKSVPVKPASPHPRWTDAADRLIRDAKGRYAALSDVAQSLGRPIAAVMQRWHQIRGMG